MKGMVGLGVGLALLISGGAGAEEEREFYDPGLPVPVIEAAGPLRAGDRVTVRWKADRSIEECELLLSLDGGRTFHLRISPELEGNPTAYAWTVPNLNARDARLRLRARVNDAEVEGPAGESFALVSDPGRPRERWLFREGGVREPGEGDAGAGAPALGPVGGARLHAVPPSLPVPPTERIVALVPTVRLLPRLTKPAPAPPAAAPPAHPLSSRFRPLRE